MSEEQKHTPGLWDAVNCFVYALNKLGTNRFSCLIQGGGPQSAKREELQANAKLIAAAPDLLDVCEELVHILETIPLTADQLERDKAARAVVQGRAAIAKAKEGK